MKALQPNLCPEDRDLMEKLLSAGRVAKKIAQRMQTVLLRARGKGSGEIADFLGIQQGTVSSYIKRYNNFGVGSLLRDKTRKPGKQPISLETKNEVCRIACNEKRNALEQPDAGQAHRHIAHGRRRDTARARAEAAQGGEAELFERPRFRGEAYGRRGAVHEPSR